MCRAASSPTCLAVALGEKAPAARRLGSNQPSRPADYLNFPCGEKEGHQAVRVPFSLGVPPLHRSRNLAACILKVKRVIFGDFDEETATSDSNI